MLVLTRKKDEQITIGDSISIVFLGMDGSRARLGIDAPKQMRVLRVPRSAADAAKICVDKQA